MPQTYKKIFENNKNWIAEKLEADKDYFDKLAAGQNPQFFFIGCSDSRVSAEEIMGLNPGEVFVHRNVSNIVNPIDMNAGSAIQYAVNNLKVNHVIVCGHYGCGGIKAAMQPDDLGLLNPWLRNIRDVYRLHYDELEAITDEHKKYDRLVELNVQEQCINIIKMACVQERYLTEDYPIIHGWVFDMKTGKIIDLNIDFVGILKKIQKVYDLTNTKWVLGRKK